MTPAPTTATSLAVYHPVARALPVMAFGESGLRFKLAKCVHLCVPSLAALAVFIALCVALRVEEFLLVVQWVRERGWKKRPKNPDQAA